MRLGLHVHTAEPGTREDALARDYIRRVQPPFVKVLGNAMKPDFLNFCRDQGCEIIGRVVFGSGDQPLSGAKAKDKIKAVVKRAEQHPQIGWWEFYNESYNGGAGESDEDFGRYAERCIEFMKKMSDIGRRAAVGSFSTGTPDEKDWPRFRKAVEHAWHNGHAICVHQYSAPDMRYMAGQNQWNDGHPRLDDPCATPDVEGLHTLRHRKFMRLVRSWGVSARLFVGESGNDDIQLRPGGQGKGWRDWRLVNPELLLGDFADQMRWYCWHLSHDPEVIGVVDFGWAPGAGEEMAWHAFDLSHRNDPGNAELAALRERLIEGQLSLPRTGKPDTDVYVPLGQPAPGGGQPAPGGGGQPQPVDPNRPLAAGDRVRNALTVNLRIRRSPGFVNKPADDVTERLAPGGEATVIDGQVTPADGLDWLRLRAGDAAVEGWAAVAGPEGDSYLTRV